MSLGLSTRAAGECLYLWSQWASCAWALPPLAMRGSFSPRHLIGPWLLPRGGGGRLSSLPQGPAAQNVLSLHLSSHAHTPLSFSVCHLMPTERAQCHLFQRGSEDENQEWVGAQSWEVLLEGGPGRGTPGLGESKSRGSRAALVSGDLLFPLLTFWLPPSSGESSRLWFQTVRVYPLAEWRDNEHRSLIG